MRFTYFRLVFVLVGALIWGFSYAAITNSSITTFSQTIQSGDIMTISWFQKVSNTLSGKCLDGQVMVGYENSGSRICVPTWWSSGLINVACSSGEYLQGFDDVWNLICRALPSWGEAPFTVELTWEEYGGTYENCGYEYRWPCNGTGHIGWKDVEINRFLCETVALSHAINHCDGRKYANVDFSWNGSIATLDAQETLNLSDTDVGYANITHRDEGGDHEFCLFSFNSPECTIVDQQVPPERWDEWTLEQCKTAAEAFVNNECRPEYTGTYDWSWNGTQANVTIYK